MEVKKITDYKRGYDTPPDDFHRWPCHKNYLVWQRVWSTQTKEGEPKKEIGRFRLCVRRLQSDPPPWVTTDLERLNHRLLKCNICRDYKHDTPLTRDAQVEPEQQEIIPALQSDYNPDKTIEQQIEDVPF